MLPPPGPERDKALTKALEGAYSPDFLGAWVRLPTPGLDVAFHNPSTDDHSALNLVLWLTTREPESERWAFVIHHHARTGTVEVQGIPMDGGRMAVAKAPTYAAAVTEALLLALEVKP